MFKTEFFWSVFSSIQSKTGNMRTWKSPYWNIFHPVQLFLSLIANSRTAWTFAWNMGQNLKYLEFNKILIWPVIFYGRSRVQNHFFRNSHWRCSIKNGALKNFTKFTGKRLRQRLFFNKVAGDSGTGVFLWILWNF